TQGRHKRIDRDHRQFFADGRRAGEPPSRSRNQPTIRLTSRRGRNCRRCSGSPYRRTVLKQQTGTVLDGDAIKTRSMYAIERFGAYANQFRRQELDTSVLHHAKRALLDWHASLFPGLQVAPVPQLRATLHDETHGADLGVRDLALLAGTAAHAAEVDDSFRQAMYHPGAATIAAALAVSRGQ